MPLYDFHCDTCEKTVELTARYDSLGMLRRHTDHANTKCAGKLTYAPGFKIRGERRQLGAVLTNGQRIPGHFGKDAKRNKKKR